MFRDARSALFAVLTASLVCAFLLQGCAGEDEDPDIVLPLQSTGLALSSSGVGSAGLPTNVDTSRTQVWEISNAWSETTTPADVPEISGRAWTS